MDGVDENAEKYIKLDQYLDNYVEATVTSQEDESDANRCYNDLMRYIEQLIEQARREERERITDEVRAACTYTRRYKWGLPGLLKELQILIDRRFEAYKRPAR